LTRDSGPAHARNTAVGLAQADLIAFTDSDCRADEHWLERGVAAFEDGVGFVSGVVLHKPEQKVEFFSGAYDELTEEHPTYPTCNAMYRRALFLQMGGFDESLCFRTFFDNKPVECADTDLAWRIKNSGWRNVFLPDLKIYHEVPLRTPLNWVIDPYRIYSVPALVKRHPQLRKILLQSNVFFRRENALFYLAIAGLPLGAMVSHWLLLLCAPYPLLMMSILRHNATVDRWPKLLAQVFLLSARQACLSAGLIYGSIRFRSLVL
jgi:GT2 family glycosyltransferase